MKNVLIVLVALAVLTASSYAAEKYTRVTGRQLLGMKTKLVKEGTKIEYPAYMGAPDKVEEQLDKGENVVGVRAKTVSPEVTVVIMHDKKNEKMLELFWELPERARVTIRGAVKEFSTGGIYILVEELEPGWPDATQVCPSCGGKGKVPAGYAPGRRPFGRGGQRPEDTR